MLNLFPGLLSFSFFIPTLLRLTVASVFVYLVLNSFKNKKAIAEEIRAKFKWVSHETAVWGVGLLLIAEVLLAAGFFLGIWTQVAAILGILGFAKMAVLRKKMPLYAPFSTLAYVLLIIICVSILISGAGAFAFDLPL